MKAKLSIVNNICIILTIVVFSSSFSMSQDEKNYQTNETRRLIEHLKKEGKDVKATLEIKDEDNDALIHVAIQTLNIEELKLLLAEGIDANLRGGPGNDLPLTMAIANFNTNPHETSVMANLLAKHGAKHDEKTLRLAAAVVHLREMENFIDRTEKKQ